MEKTTPKKLKGTVLFTVVSVMMVLIVFLAATLALATTASKRAYTSYQQEQTEYTAKAVMEAVTRQIQSDETIREDIVNGLGSVDVAINDGTATQTHTVNVINTGQKRSVYDSGEWKEVDMYRLSVTVGSDTTTAESTYETFLGLDIITTPGVTPPTSNYSGAFVSLGDTGGNEIATGGYVTGGTYLGIKEGGHDFTLASNSATVIDAPLYVNGNVSNTNALNIHFTKPDDFMVVKGNLKLNNPNMSGTVFDGYNESEAKTYENTPYIYVEDEFSFTGNNVLKLGEAHHPINLYFGTCNITTGGMELYGDLYLMDEDESVISVQDQYTKLYQWADGQLTRADGNSNTQYGNIYANGSLKLTGTNKELEVNGDLQVNGDLTVTNLRVKGNVVVNGTLTVSNSLICDGDVYASSIQASNNITCNSGVIHAVTASGVISYDPIDPAVLTSSASKNIEIWYTDVWIDPNGEAQWADGKGYMKASYTKHSTIDGVAQPDETVTNVDIVGWTEGIDTTAFTSFADYAASVNTVAFDIQHYTSEATAKTDTQSSYDLSSVYGKEVYPQQYTKAYLNTTEYEADGVTVKKQAKIENPQASSYESSYPTSINDLDASIYNGSSYVVPIYAPGGSANTTHGSTVSVENADDLIPSGDSYYKITSNCVLNGYFSKNIYIDGSVGNITVVMDRVTMEGNYGCSIIVNDTNNVTIFVVDYLNLGTSGQGTSLITTEYLNAMKPGWQFTDNLKNVVGGMSNDIYVKQIQDVSDPLYPNVVINSDDGAILNVPEGGLVVGLVRAPKLAYVGGKVSDANKTIQYELSTGEVVNYGNGCSLNNCKSVGLIGQLIAGQIKLPSNGDWGMLYITKPSSLGSDPLDPPDPLIPGTTTSVWATLYGNMY